MKGVEFAITQDRERMALEVAKYRFIMKIHGRKIEGERQIKRAAASDFWFASALEVNFVPPTFQ